jgi:hypothetical protein
MDREDILKMEAGRELDVLVAEKVMGEIKPVYSHEFHIEPKWSIGGNWYCLPEYSSGDICEWQPKPFSTYIAAAWEVVEKIQSNGDVLSLTYLEDFGEMMWDVHFRIANTFAYAPTAPLAICRAALLAVMEVE